MEIRAGLLAVLLTGESYDEELLIFDWKTTQCIAVSYGYSRRSYILKLCTIKRLMHKDVSIDDFRFLSDNVLVVVANAKDASLDLFTLPESQGDTPITNVAKLLLPDIPDKIAALSFSNPPAKNGIARRLQVDGAGDFAKPFTNSSNNIIYCHIVVTDSQVFDFFSLLVHSSTLLCHADIHDFKSTPWYEWSPMARCIRDLNHPATSFSRQRCLSWGKILDFNQYRVKQLGLGFAG